MAQSTTAPPIRLEAMPYQIGSSTIVRLPENASAQLPSRGQVAVQGKINGEKFQTVLEPDGRGGHWMRVEDRLQGEPVKLEIAPAERWPEPAVPADLEAALAAAPQRIRDLWKDITPMARWEWVRWVNATANPDTRKRRVEVTVSKMSSGKRRPCCFDLSACTDVELASGGRLRQPA